MLNPDLLAPEKLRPLRREEYDRLVELGAFEDERIELLYGSLIEMTPQGAPHAEVIRRLNRMLVIAVGDRAIVQVQSPFAASDDSEPEPDLAIVPTGDYSRSHPSQALLIIEVADSSARKDRVLKAELYASAGVPEYWLVDLARSVIEVRTKPLAGRYSELASRLRGEMLQPLAFPDISVTVSDLLLG